MLWRVLMIACLTAVAAAGLDWGLPSGRGDGYLFATVPWTGIEIAALSGDRPSNGAADVDQNPVNLTNGPAVLNGTDANRAGILRRYRLYSHQPDEMITFMSLAGMNPSQGQLDPKLYQYGGLWIYPVGALLKACDTLGWIDVRSDLAFYYDHPEAFGRFYVVARAYSLLWYVVAIACCGAIVKRLTDDAFAAVIAVATAGVLPVAFALSHEAKPHLAGAALALAAALAAERWVRGGRWRDVLLAGGLIGASAGAVLTGTIAIVLLPVMAIVRRDSAGRRIGAMLLGIAAAVAVYAALDPYVVLHLTHHDAVLAGNLSNTQAMYGVHSIGDALLNAGGLLNDALSWPAAAVAAMAVIIVLVRRNRPSPMAWLLAALAVAAIIPFALFAADKPAEYARFALLPAFAIGILCVWAIASSITRPGVRRAAAAALPVSVFLAGTLPYYRAFAEDAGEADTRTLAAAALQRVESTGATLQVYVDAAPYCLPPVDFSNWRVILTRPGDPPIGAAIARPIDDPDDLPPPPRGYTRQIVGTLDRPAPITWANKPFELLIRQ